MQFVNCKKRQKKHREQKNAGHSEWNKQTVTTQETKERTSFRIRENLGRVATVPNEFDS